METLKGNLHLLYKVAYYDPISFKFSLVINIGICNKYNWSTTTKTVLRKRRIENSVSIS